jgi:hypothetical protein|tara:strand:+ start:171 stop:593 length:423 start_codon:yes stop_codon:yes gene_type:complete
MKSIKLITIVALFWVFITGCGSVNQSHIYSPVGVSISSEMTADVDVDLSKKLTGSAKASYFLGIGIFKMSGDSKYADGYGGMGTTGKVKAAAAFDAISKSDGDILVSPQYVVTTSFIFPIKTISVDVSGFEGKIKEIKHK